ncbi:MAG: aldolase/citrate lyase family protein [Rhodospirillaceae bacterium]|nr:aldolase/citrate lyase family protein [Rhodospirillaceae bacterium]
MAHDFRSRLRRQETMVGTWVKTPAPVVCEVLSLAGLDVLALDAEHAPFGRAELDGCLAICVARGMPALVRVPSAEPAHILNALDCGATGVMVPHVITPELAEAAVRASHYGRGGRGYAGSTRAAGFAGRPIGEQLSVGREHTVVIAQIEDAEALGRLDEIAAVKGIDALFVGRIDLTVSLGKTSPDDPDVIAAVEAVCAAGRQAGVAVGMFVADPPEARKWIPRGASLFVLGSDQGFILSGARGLIGAVK